MAISPDSIAAQIVDCDRAFAPVIEAIGPPKVFRPTPPAKRFATVVSSITSQLLSIKAADTIYGRVVAACGGVVTPETIAALTHDELRSTGLSNAKVASIHDVAARVRGGTLNLARHGRMSDDEVLGELVAIRGIGTRTAHMYLLFTLGRPDIWPTGDLGVRNGWSLLHGETSMISAGDLGPLGDPFTGFRSATAWYCWQAVHLHRGDR